MVKKRDLLRVKKYNYLDYFFIPLSVCPIATIIKIVNSILCALLPTISVLITAKFVDLVVQSFNENIDNSLLNVQFILLILVIVFQYLNKYFIAYFDKKCELKLTRLLKTSIIEKRSRLLYRYIEDNDTWNLLSRVSKDSQNRLFSGFNNLLNLLNLCIRASSLLIILSTKVLWAGFATLGLSIPLIHIAVKAGQKTYDANKSVEKYRRKYLYYQDVLRSRDNIEERSLFGYFEKINNEWKNKYEEARKVVLKAELRNYFSTKLSGLIMAMLSIIICTILVVPLKNHEISIGIFMSLIAAFFNLVNVIVWELIEIMKELSNGKEFLKDFCEVCKLEEVDETEDDHYENVEFESIEFRNVSFAYPGTDCFTLKNFNLLIEKNKHYAFVGVNGCGKTTITKLLLKMYTNYSGDILINGRDLRLYSLNEIRSVFSVVFQDYGRYNISFRDNLVIGERDEIDEGRLSECIDNIGLKSVIEKLPNGIDNYLGKINEGGIDISGGEWQKIAIGRSLYNQAPVRIFDEPTAALDPIIESQIYSMFDMLSSGKTTIFITHRLGAAKIADTIVVIENGCVKEMGNHENLIRINGVYANMYKSQESWYL